MAVPARDMASRAYSTWYSRPSGEKMVVCEGAQHGHNSEAPQVLLWNRIFATWLLAGRMRIWEKPKEALAHIDESWLLHEGVHSTIPQMSTAAARHLRRASVVSARSYTCLSEPGKPLLALLILSCGCGEALPGHPATGRELYVPLLVPKI